MVKGLESKTIRKNFDLHTQSVQQYFHVQFSENTKCLALKKLLFQNKSKPFSYTMSSFSGSVSFNLYKCEVCTRN